MRPFCIFVVVALLACGCTSRMPEPVNHPYSQQYKLQASQHWNVLAQDLANRINNELILSDNINTSVFVQETCGDESTPCAQNQSSSFHEAFRDLLITNLVGFGIPTERRNSSEAIDIQYKVQMVRHDSTRVRTVQPGVMTVISAAIVVLRNAPAEVLILAGGVAADIANTTLTSNGHYEVIITTSMVSKGQYLFRASDIYYINDKDFWQYQQNGPGTSTIHLSQKTNNYQPMVHKNPEMTSPQTMDEKPIATTEKKNNI